jgi:hypothetical protein
LGVCLRRFRGCLTLAGAGSNLTGSPVKDREEALDAAVGQFGPWDFWPLVAQNIVAIKAWYAQGVQICRQA